MGQFQLNYTGEEVNELLGAIKKIYKHEFELQILSGYKRGTVSVSVVTFDSAPYTNETLPSIVGAYIEGKIITHKDTPSSTMEYYAVSPSFSWNGVITQYWLYSLQNGTDQSVRPSSTQLTDVVTPLN